MRKCPLGKFRGSTNGENRNDCDECTAGFVCSEEG